MANAPAGPGSPSGPLLLPPVVASSFNVLNNSDKSTGKKRPVDNLHDALEASTSGSQNHKENQTKRTRNTRTQPDSKYSLQYPLPKSLRESTDFAKYYRFYCSSLPPPPPLPPLGRLPPPSHPSLPLHLLPGSWIRSPDSPAPLSPVLSLCFQDEVAQIVSYLVQQHSFEEAQSTITLPPYPQSRQIISSWTDHFWTWHSRIMPREPPTLEELANDLSTHLPFLPLLTLLPFLV